MTSIKHLLHINASREAVYHAIATLKGLSNWWTVQVTGDEKIGGIIRFRFGDQGPDMKVTGLKPFDLVTWECVGGEGWIGNEFSFVLDENDRKTRIRFEHSGWNETGDFYASCSFSWARYMESLRQYCQAGKGEAFGSDNYRK